MRDAAFWWLLVPTILFLYLARDIGNTLVVAAIGVGLWYVRTIPGVPPAIRSYLPLLQALMVFFFLGGNPFVIFVVGAALAVAVLQRDPLLALLEPWWQLQQQIPPTTRRVLAFVIPFLIGYLFGQSALGFEWTSTFLSLTIGTIVAFLLIFTPPASMRRPAMGGPR
ncbi:MAG: hypothetical protein A2Z21_00895 [Candidatus Fraserbacteria bacterium RBG_16_55_9]|uniref:Uncharacterized protein n=1 Tax=Fraserbacteria sp. (strain RBG_16_55_9) TaxID=1817864 RepID=A0A1F5V2W1_FRAXR|nr:MAG: hypothetical protein A2Z21_00895 [Candidatus Fraserbacteria bacterium RBG_16_55_9]